MHHLTFKNNDTLPSLGLGTWLSKPGEVGTAIREAIRIGYRHIDCAAVYGNEVEIGQALADAFAAGEVKREDLWITSKLWNTQHRQGQVRPALEKTLADLQLDYLDLYLVHWPVAIKENSPFPYAADSFITLEELPIIETWQGMENCLEAGLSKHIGVANFSVKKLQGLLAAAKYPPEMNQVEAHPFFPQNELLIYCQENGIHFTAYSPLGSPGRAGRSELDPSLFESPVIVEIAKSHDCSPAQVLLNWAVQRGTSVIPKSTNPVRLRQNFEAASLDLTVDDMSKIAKIKDHYRYIDGSFFTPKGSPYTMENLWDEG